jgi:acyl-CoA reductase-like NAD-dependent aldehyde dehydrogenase
MSVAEARVDLLPEPGFLVGDRRVTTAGGGRHEHVYAATGKTTSVVGLAGPEEIDQAVAAARAAFPAWRRTTGDRRRDLLLEVARLVRENAQRLAQLNVVDNSTPIMIASLQTSMTSDLFTYNAGWADKVGGEVVPTWPVAALDYALDEPYGVVGVIIPWNGPLTAIGQVVAPALAAGNCVVVKPPELAPYSALEMARLFLEAGFPPGVVTVLPGGASAGEALVTHPDVDKVHFTGSAATARAIHDAAGATLKPLGLELGGKSAVVVFDDADLDTAAQAAIQGISMGLSGQGCINGTRVLVQRGIYDDLVEQAVAAVADVPIGDPADVGTMMGPVITAASADRILAVIGAAVSGGHGRLITGGERLDGDLADGFYIAPTIFADVDAASPLAQQEIFGPVQSIIPFDTEAEAVAIANGTLYGLAGYVHTRDLTRAHRVADALDVGNVWVNGGFGIPAAAPFGGVKQSGQGRLGGRAGITEFTRPKNIWVAL